MTFYNPNYSFKRSPYCQYCGSKSVKWRTTYDRNRREKWILADIETNDPHYLNCLSRRESVNSKQAL